MQTRTVSVTERIPDPADLYFEIFGTLCRCHGGDLAGEFQLNAVLTAQELSQLVSIRSKLRDYLLTLNGVSLT